MKMFRQLLRPAIRNVSQRGSHGYHGTPATRPPTMDEMPVPSGSWQEHYDSRQKIYNLLLAGGITYAAVTFTYIVSTGAIYFNWAPPVPKDK